MSLLKNVSSLKELFQELREDDGKLVVIEFMHSFCYACQMVKPKFRRMMPNYAKKVKFCRVELADVPNAVDSFDLGKIPTFVAFHQKEEVARYTGHDERDLATFIAEGLKEKRRRTAQAQKLLDPRKAVLGRRRRSQRARGLASAGTNL